jgi:hypothetical protein
MLAALPCGRRKSTPATAELRRGVTPKPPPTLIATCGFGPVPSLIRGSQQVVGCGAVLRKTGTPVALVMFPKRCPDNPPQVGKFPAESEQTER